MHLLQVKEQNTIKPTTSEPTKTGGEEQRVNFTGMLIKVDGIPMFHNTCILDRTETQEKFTTWKKLKLAMG